MAKGVVLLALSLDSSAEFIMLLYIVIKDFFVGVTMVRELQYLLALE